MKVVKMMKKKAIFSLVGVLLSLTSLYAVDDNLVINGDIRTSVDSLQYEMANGNKVKNNSLLNNRLWLDIDYSPDEKSNFHLKLSYNKAFGQVNLQQNGNFDTFDWYANEKNTDSKVRIKEAYWNYIDSNFLGTGLHWKFGIGRRPSTNGSLIALREDDKPTSPISHISNAEFDGGSISIYLEKLTKLSGSAVKFASGRGSTTINPSISSTPNSSENTSNINIFNVNIIYYNDDNLRIESQSVYATNLIDIKNAGYDNLGNFNFNNYDTTFEVAGDILLNAFMASYKFDNLNDLMIFGSYAISKTNPDNSKSMLGSSDDKTGTSYWIGLQQSVPMIESAKYGIEFNRGSKYFRPFTYAEDTVVGSKIATRGKAYEAYYTQQLNKEISFQIRYTYLEYEYTGSNGFFGSQTGMPMKISSIPNSDLANDMVNIAQDTRLYIRYRF